MFKVLEKKSGLEGVAKAIEGKDGITTYEIALPGKDPKIVAESTLKRNYKKIKDEVAVTEVAAEDGGNQMQEEVVIVEEQIKENLENKNEEVGIIEVEEETNELVEMALNPEIIEEPITVVEAKSEKVEKIEVVLTEQDELEVEMAANQISSIINALAANKAIIEKNSRNTKLTVDTAKIIMTLEYNNSLIDYIVDALKEKMENVEIEYINQQKRSNPAAFKARGVRTTNSNGEEKTFKTRNDAMIWITKEFEDGKLDKKPTYYQVKKALENNGEYAGYKWEEIDPSEVTIEA